jgi:8-oxo-dGTP diphosphatase
MGSGEAGRAPVSGDGFVTLADGTRRWGRFGAAGILARCPGDDGSWWYFLARRSQLCHQGGTWAVPGGALNDGEAPLDGALREFAEEIGVSLSDFTVVDVHEDDHGGWSYWTVILELSERFPVPPVHHWETAEADWISDARLAELELLVPFRRTLTRLGILGEGDVQA